jgi:DNA replication and repair protein RecF
LQLSKLQLKNFRCFNQIDVDLDAPIILIQGENGSGKTSVLEALSYLCFLRSFRTHITKELINEKNDNFFIKAEFSGLDNSAIQVGFSGKKRLVKINGKAAQSYKDIMNHYRTVTLIDDDLDLIKGSPEIRRSFIDQYIILENPQFLHKFRKYKQIQENKNALLLRGNYKYDDYLLWTKSLWEQGKIIQQLRIDALQALQQELNNIVFIFFPELKMSFKYEAKHDLLLIDNLDSYIESRDLYTNEQIQRRSLFGPHLDDFSIIFHDKKTKVFASRGQQKLLILLIKVAQIKLLMGKLDQSSSIAFLLDDFMTDFDSKKLETLVPMLCSLGIQLIFTSPLQDSQLKQILIEKNALIVYLN